MSLTFGYDLKDGDKILEAPKQLNILLRGLASAGIAILYFVPFCAVSNFVPACYQYLRAIISAARSFMGPIPQLRTIGPKR